MQQSTLSSGAFTEQLHAIRSNNEQALKRLYQENYRKVETYVCNNSGTEDEAKDVYQEAFIAVWRNIQLDRFQPDSAAALNAYLYQVAHNKWIDQLRMKKTRKTVSWDDTPGSLEPLLPTEEETDHIELVKKHFTAIGDQCRELLKLFYYEKESLRSIAAHFSWTEASAKNNKYRCLQKLRTLINP